MQLKKKYAIHFICFFFLILTPHNIMAAQQIITNYYVYISLKNENAIVIYKMDPETGGLDKIYTEPIAGAPAALAVDPTKRYMYVAQCSAEAISVYSIDGQTGRLNYINTISAVDIPVYIATDINGRYLLSAYYGSNKSAIYPINLYGRLQSPATQIISTGKNPHSILTDNSNRYVFIPNTGADKILQYKFNAKTGKMTLNDPSEIATAPGAGPRHFDFHGTKNILYFVNEKNSSVSSYNLNDKTGTLSPSQTISTLPEDFSGKNTCADIHLTPDNRFLYASNRGHESIAAYSIDANTGKLTSLGQYATEKTPREFDIDPTGNFLFAAGESSDSLASYRINQISGQLETLHVIYVGDRPSWVLAVDFMSP